MEILYPQDNSNNPRSAQIIKVVGVGGGGSNAVNKMVAANLFGVDFVAVNTDLQALRESSAPVKVQIGEKLTKGLGVGGDPAKGKKAAEESVEILRGTLKGSNMVFITAGMGGGTGTGAAPVISKIAKEEGILTVGVVTKPFVFEGEMKMKQADEGIASLAPYVDALITISNENVFHINNMIDDKTPWKVLFGFIDDVLRRSIQSVTDMITLHGEKNIDFADVETALRNSKTALIGIGESSGDVREAFEKAIENPMTEKFDISSAKYLLVNIEGPSSLSTKQIKDFSDRIHDFGINENCFFKDGLRVGNKLDNKIKITVLAAGSQNDISKLNYDEPPKIGQRTFDDIDGSEDASKIDFSKPAYTYWKTKKLK